MATGLGVDTATYAQWRSFAYYPDGSLRDAWSALRTALEAVSSDAAKTTYFYDGHGNRTARRSWTQNSAADTPHVIIEKWTYDDAGRIETYTDPIQTAATTPVPTEYAYYAGTASGTGVLPGALHTITQPSGRTVTATYRPDGLLAGQVFHDPNTGALPDVTTAFGYNAFGQRTRMSDQNGSAAAQVSTWTRDALGRIVSQSVPNRTDNTTSTTTWLYSVAGDLREMGYPDGAKLQFSHDPGGALNATKVYVAGVCCTQIASYIRDVIGEVSRDNIGGSSAQNRKWFYNSNGSRQPTRFTEIIADPGGDKIVETDMTYRADGRLASEQTGSDPTQYYGYDDAGQLCAEGPTVTVGSPGTELEFAL